MSDWSYEIGSLPRIPKVIRTTLDALSRRGHLPVSSCTERGQPSYTRRYKDWLVILEVWAPSCLFASLGASEREEDFVFGGDVWARTEQYIVEAARRRAYGQRETIGYSFVWEGWLPLAQDRWERETYQECLMGNQEHGAGWYEIGSVTLWRKL